MVAVQLHNAAVPAATCVGLDQDSLVQVGLGRVCGPLRRQVGAQGSVVIIRDEHAHQRDEDERP